MRAEQGAEGRRQPDPTAEAIDSTEIVAPPAARGNGELPQQLHALAAETRWVVWRYEIANGRKTKVPYRATGGKASSTNPRTWVTYAELPLGAFDGPGIMLGDGLQGVDLDACIDDAGDVEGWAAEVVARLDSYTEVSPSGRGLKVFFYGVPAQSCEVGFGDPVTLPDGSTKRRELAHFAGARYFCVTGIVHRDTPLRTVDAETVTWLQSRVETIRASNKPAKKTTERAARPEPDAEAKPQGTAPAGLPKWMRDVITAGAPEGKRSEKFFAVVKKLAEMGHDAAAIERILNANPHGIAEKYAERLPAEIERALGKEGTPDAPAPELAAQREQRAAVACKLTDFYAHLPRGAYLYVPTRELWPGDSVDTAVDEWPANPWKDGQQMAPSAWLAQMRPIHQMTWAPDEPMVIEDRVVDAGGWLPHEGARVFNLYRPPGVSVGNPHDVAPWLDHIKLIYPGEWEHIVRWFAQRVQCPGQKVNHALVLGGAQGIGKDTVLEPLKLGVGAWNCQEISPGQMMGRFNGWAKSVIVRVSEARDLGDTDRFAFYDHSKTYIAAPPDVIRVDEKNLREHYVLNVMGVIITTNHKTDGIFLPDDDRRHFVAWSDATKEDFAEDYWRRMWSWYQAGGLANVVAYLRALDLSDFDPKAPPPKTAAFFAIVSANQAPEDAEMHDVIERTGSPDVVTLDALIGNAEALGLTELAFELRDRKSRRRLPHKLERAGYVPVRNPDANDGLWKLAGRRQTIYGRKTATLAQQIRAARAMQEGRPWSV